MEIQSSAEAVTWLQEFRFLRILASDRRAETGHEDISKTDIRKFCLEKLRPAEMLKIERVLTCNSALFKEYIALKLEVSCDKKLIYQAPDANVKSMLLNKEKAKIQIHRMQFLKLNCRILLCKTIRVFKAEENTVLASGFALASVVALAGTKNIGLWGQLHLALSLFKNLT